MFFLFHWNEMAEDDIVIPLSRSWGRKSITVSPVSTRPIAFVVPPRKSICSEVVVFPSKAQSEYHQCPIVLSISGVAVIVNLLPASIWATTPTFLIEWIVAFETLRNPLKIMNFLPFDTSNLRDMAHIWWLSDFLIIHRWNGTCIYRQHSASPWKRECSRVKVHWLDRRFAWVPRNKGSWTVDSRL